MRIPLPALACLMTCLWFSAPASAQNLVYRIEISHAKGINFHTFDGGFFAAPILGGAGSFLLTSVADGRTFTESTAGGRLFTAVGEGKKQSVISGTTGTGTAHGAFVALGDIDHSLSVNSPTTSLTVRVAKSLTGSTVSADDESTATAPATDGSIGSAGFAQIKLVLDEAQTNQANRAGLSLAQTMEQLKVVLGTEGYSPAPAPTPTPTPTTPPPPTTPATTTTTTGTATSTTAGP